MLTAYWKNAYKNRFKLIKPGEFWMGSLPVQRETVNEWNNNIRPSDEMLANENYHLVKIERPFYVDAFPTTVPDFDMFDSAYGYEKLMSKAARDNESPGLVDVWRWGKGSDVRSQACIWSGNGEERNDKNGIKTTEKERYGWAKQKLNAKSAWRDVCWNFSYEAFDLACERKEEPQTVNKIFCQGFDNPVVGVNRKEIFEYVNWLNNTDRIQNAYKDMLGFAPTFRLMTEAEYEYCQRAGACSIFPWGDDPEGAREYANVADEGMKIVTDVEWERPFDIARSRSPQEKAEGRTFAMTSPVGAFEPNNFGLYDMTGNVLEATADVFTPDYSGEPEAYHGATYDERCQQIREFYAHQENAYFNQDFVCKGGAWCGGPDVCRSASRIPRNGWFRSDYLGFRICFDAKDQDENR